eukprot:TRINITY_DN23659_c1_g1_i6.p1 TRINITY_DN23659_c1_g1~~TRINITY_DN23659_c1_g1_i6.p1  ORF type:complete len:1878 (+),score=323.58 TRINITY_DN23659_c1_g1_i6:78-5636(+)
MSAVSDLRQRSPPAALCGASVCPVRRSAQPGTASGLGPGGLRRDGLRGPGAPLLPAPLRLPAPLHQEPAEFVQQLPAHTVLLPAAVPAAAAERQSRLPAPAQPRREAPAAPQPPPPCPPQHLIPHEEPRPVGGPPPPPPQRMPVAAAPSLSPLAEEAPPPKRPHPATTWVPPGLWTGGAVRLSDPEGSPPPEAPAPEAPAPEAPAPEAPAPEAPAPAAAAPAAAPPPEATSPFRVLDPRPPAAPGCGPGLDPLQEPRGPGGSRRPSADSGGAPAAHSGPGGGRPPGPGSRGPPAGGDDEDPAIGRELEEGVSVQRSTPRKVRGAPPPSPSRRGGRPATGRGSRRSSGAADGASGAGPPTPDEPHPAPPPPAPQPFRLGPGRGSGALGHDAGTTAPPLGAGEWPAPGREPPAAAPHGHAARGDPAARWGAGGWGPQGECGSRPQPEAAARPRLPGATAQLPARGPPAGGAQVPEPPPSPPPSPGAEQALGAAPCHEAGSLLDAGPRGAAARAAAAAAAAAAAYDNPPGQGRRNGSGGGGSAGGAAEGGSSPRGGGAAAVVASPRHASPPRRKVGPSGVLVPGPLESPRGWELQRARPDASPRAASADASPRATAPAAAAYAPSARALVPAGGSPRGGPLRQARPDASPRAASADASPRATAPAAAAYAPSARALVPAGGSPRGGPLRQARPDASPPAAADAAGVLVPAGGSPERSPRGWELQRARPDASPRAGSADASPRAAPAAAAADAPSAAVLVPGPTERSPRGWESQRARPDASPRAAPAAAAAPRVGAAEPPTGRSAPPLLGAAPPLGVGAAAGEHREPDPPQPLQGGGPTQQPETAAAAGTLQPAISAAARTHPPLPPAPRAVWAGLQSPAFDAAADRPPPADAARAAWQPPGSPTETHPSQRQPASPSGAGPADSPRAQRQPAGGFSPEPRPPPGGGEGERLAREAPPARSPRDGRWALRAAPELAVPPPDGPPPPPCSPDAAGPASTAPLNAAGDPLGRSAAPRGAAHHQATGSEPPGPALRPPEGPPAAAPRAEAAAARLPLQSPADTVGGAGRPPAPRTPSPGAAPAPHVPSPGAAHQAPQDAAAAQEAQPSPAPRVPSPGAAQAAPRDAGVAVRAGQPSPAPRVPSPGGGQPAGSPRAPSHGRCRPVCTDAAEGQEGQPGPAPPAPAPGGGAAPWGQPARSPPGPQHCCSAGAAVGRDANPLATGAGAPAAEVLERSCEHSRRAEYHFEWTRLQRSRLQARRHAPPPAAVWAPGQAPELPAPEPLAAGGQRAAPAAQCTPRSGMIFISPPRSSQPKSGPIAAAPRRPSPQPQPQPLPESRPLSRLSPTPDGPLPGRPRSRQSTDSERPTTVFISRPAAPPAPRADSGGAARPAPPAPAAPLPPPVSPARKQQQQQQQRSSLKLSPPRAPRHLADPLPPVEPSVCCAAPPAAVWATAAAPVLAPGPEPRDRWVELVVAMLREKRILHPAPGSLLFRSEIKAALSRRLARKGWLSVAAPPSAAPRSPRSPRSARVAVIAGSQESGKSCALHVAAAELVIPSLAARGEWGAVLITPLHWPAALAAAAPQWGGGLGRLRRVLVEVFTDALCCQRPGLQRWRDPLVGLCTDPPPAAALERLLAAAPDGVAALRPHAAAVGAALGRGDEADAFRLALLLPEAHRAAFGFRALLWLQDSLPRPGASVGGVDLLTAVLAALRPPQAAALCAADTEAAAVVCRAVTGAFTVDTRGLVPTSALGAYPRIPRRICCGGSEYTAAVFGGCPGYVAPFVQLMLSQQQQQQQPGAEAEHASEGSISSGRRLTVEFFSEDISALFRRLAQLHPPPRGGSRSRSPRAAGGAHAPPPCP